LTLIGFSSGLVPAPTALAASITVNLALPSVPQNFDVGADGTVYVADQLTIATNRQKIVRISAGGTVLGQYEVATDQKTISDVAVASNGELFVTAPGIPLAQYKLFHLLGDGSTVAQDAWFTPGLGRIAVGPGTDVYFASSEANTVTRYTSAGVVVSTFPIPGPAIDVAVDSTGDVYVLVGSLVYKYTATGTLVTSWTGPTNPTALDVGPSGDIYVSGTTLVRYSPTGATVSVSSQKGQLLALGPGPVVWTGQASFPTLTRWDRTPRAIAVASSVSE
jgi:hypothetical protein